MKKISLLLVVGMLGQAQAAQIFVPAYNLISTQIAKRRITLTLTEAGPVTSGPWLIVGDSVAQYTDVNGMTTFSNVVAGGYRLDIAGTPSRSFPIGVPDTNATINVVSLVGATNTVPYFYTAAQIDALLAGAGGGNATNAIAKTNGTGYGTTLKGTTLGDTIAGTNFVGDGGNLTNLHTANISDAMNLAFDPNGFFLGTNVNGGVTTVTVTNNGTLSSLVVLKAGSTMAGSLTNASPMYFTNTAFGFQIPVQAVNGSFGNELLVGGSLVATTVGGSTVAGNNITAQSGGGPGFGFFGFAGGLTNVNGTNIDGTLTNNTLGTANVALFPLVGVGPAIGALGYSEVGNFTDSGDPSLLYPHVVNGLVLNTNYPVDYKHGGLAYYDVNLTNDAYFIYSTNVLPGRSSTAIFRLISGRTNRSISWNTNFSLYLSLGLSTTNTSFVLNSNHTARLMFENIGIGDTNTGLQVWAGFGAVSSSGGVSITVDSTVITVDSTIITVDHT